MDFMMQKALGELFILKSTKPLPIIFKIISIQLIFLFFSISSYDVHGRWGKGHPTPHPAP